MVDITSISHGASSSLLYNIHHVARSILRMIGEDHHIATQDEEVSMSHGPSIRLAALSRAVRMQSIRGRGRGRGRGRPSERGGHRSGGRVAGHSTNETSILPEYSTSPPRLPYYMSIPHHPLILSYHQRIPHHP